MAKYLLGIEQSESQLKIAAFKVEGKNLMLGVIGKIPLKLDSLTQDLSRWINEHLPDPEKVEAILSISESSIYLKTFEMPAMSDKQISESVYWEASKVVPFSQSEAVIDWKSIGKAGEKNVVAMISKEGYIKDFVDKIEDANVDVLTIEPNSISFSRIARADFSRTTLLMVVEEKETDLIILKNEAPVFSTSVNINLGGKQKDKRKLKKDVTEELAQSAKKILSFWEEKEDEKILQVIITGDISYKYFGLARAINEFAKVPVVVGKRKLTKGIRTTGIKENKLYRYYVPIGAAARYLEKNIYDGVNLLPKERKEILLNKLSESRKFQYLNRVSALNGGFILLLLVIYISMTVLSLSTARKVGQAEKFVENHPAQKLEKDIQNTNTYAKAVKKHRSQVVDVGERLKILAAMTPENIEFSNVDYNQTENKHEWRIQGTGDRGSVLAFYKKLQRDLDAEEVEMPYSSIQDDTENSFVIAVIW